VNFQQVKWNGGTGQKGTRERQSSGIRERERRSIGKKLFWHGSEMAISEMKDLSIFINVNQ